MYILQFLDLLLKHPLYSILSKLTRLSKHFFWLRLEQNLANLGPDPPALQKDYSYSTYCRWFSLATARYSVHYDMSLRASSWLVMSICDRLRQIQTCFIAYTVRQPTVPPTEWFGAANELPYRKWILLNILNKFTTRSFYCISICFSTERPRLFWRSRIAKFEEAADLDLRICSYQLPNKDAILYILEDVPYQMVWLLS